MRKEEKKAKRPTWVKWIAVAACITVLIAITSFVSKNRKNLLKLTDASQGVTVRYTDNAPKVKSSSDLINLTEEELFSYFDTAIFKGTITKIDNIILNFNGHKDYSAIARIEIEKVYRGIIQEGSTISVLLPCPISDDIWVEDTETVSAMKVGMTGIFMPMVYDETSVREENGAKLALKDIADFGFADGSRYAFLETDDGLMFAKWAYESINDATTLEQVEEYIFKMLGSQSYKNKN